jgi:hypothetical protein
MLDLFKKKSIQVCGRLWIQHRFTVIFSTWMGDNMTCVVFPWVTISRNLPSCQKWGIYCSDVAVCLGIRPSRTDSGWSPGTCRCCCSSSWSCLKCIRNSKSCGFWKRWSVCSKFSKWFQTPKPFFTGLNGLSMWCVLENQLWHPWNISRTREVDSHPRFRTFTRDLDHTPMI